MSRYGYLFPEEREEEQYLENSPVPPFEMPAEAVPQAPVVAEQAAQVAPEVVEPEEASVPKLNAHTLAQLLGIKREEMLPKAPTPNANRFSADLSRAGAQIAGGIANVKPDTSYADSLEKRGADDALRQDKANMDETNFNQALGLKVLDNKMGKGGEDPDLNDPSKPAWKAMYAQYKAGNPEFLSELESQTLAAGLPHINWNKVSIKPNVPYSQAQTNDRTDKNIKAGFGKQTRAFGQQDKVLATRFSMDLDKMSMGDAYKQAGEMRHSNIVNRATLPNATPTAGQATIVLRKDADSLVAKGAIEELVQATSKLRPEELANPFANADFKRMHQDILNKIRVNEQFGVPSGKDMEQLERLVADPTTLSAIVKDQAFDQLRGLANSVARDAEVTANNYGYDVWGSGAKKVGGVSLPDKVRSSITNKYGPKGAPTGAPAPAASPSPATSGPTTPGGNPYSKKITKKNGTVVYVDAENNVVP